MRTVIVRDETGSALIVAIMFLLLLSTLALAALRSSTSNVQIVGNMQARQEAQAAAQMLIEQTISTDEFARNPAGLKTVAKVETDVNGDGTAEATAVLAEVPKCLRVKAVPLADLDPANPADAICFGSASIGNLSGGGGAPAGSLCADTEWQLVSNGSDPKSGASVTIRQGVTVRREIIGLNGYCNN